MIKNIFIEPTYAEYASICVRPRKDENNLTELISAVFDQIQKDGDRALIDLTHKFDKVLLENVELSTREKDEAIQKVSEELKSAIQIAYNNISAFHKAQVDQGIEVETMPGVICNQKSVGIEKVGIYIPGGTAPLFSTVLMLAIPAKLAGCKEIVLCSPPNQEGSLHPAIVYAADLCGVTKIFKVGGAQAIAALSVGTESVPSVSKLFGPGNQYVTAAKQYAQNFRTGMDIPAGPSELLVYADDSSFPEFVAADLLSQAEHGVDSQVILVVNNKEKLHLINAEVEKQVNQLPRKEIALAALDNSKAVVLSDSHVAFDFINEYGPEHLIIASDESEILQSLVVNAGSVFLGNYCPESAGDYASGTNHTLPTNGWAKSYGGVNVDSFCRKITFQKISKAGIQNIGGAIMEMASNELLEGHARAVEVRLNNLTNQG